MKEGDIYMNGRYYSSGNRGSYNDPWDKEKEKQYIGMCLSVVGFFIILILAMIMSGCTSIRYIPVETIKTEYVSKIDTFIKKDSVHIKDSVFVTVKNDTVIVDRWHIKYKDKWEYKIVTDTIIKTDSVQVPYPVEKSLTKWQQIKLDAGGMAIGGCLVFLLIIIVGFFVRAYRKT